MIRFARLSLVASLSFCTIGFAAAPVAAQESAARVHADAERPKALVPLYLSFSALQVLDAHSTWRALNAGAAESNPLLKGVVGNQVGLIAAKAAGAAAVVAISEHLYKTNRTAAVLLMVLSNSAMAVVVEHNYRAVH